MLCSGCRGLRSFSTLQRAFRRVLSSLPSPPRSYARISFPQSALIRQHPRTLQEEAASQGNLDTVPNWSVDPRTQKSRPGSNWTYDKELFALARRIGYDLTDLPKLGTALTHQSALIQLASQEGEEAQLEALVEHNSRLSFLGKTLVQYFVTEHLLAAYPNMQAMNLADLSVFLSNDEALVKLADHIGITDLIRTQKKLADSRMQKIIVRALLATVSCLHLDQGPAAARKFITEFITSKMAGVDLHEVIKLQHPRYVLRSILASQGLPGPESRLLKETGRATHFPTFVVGVYSGDKLLGEGCGTSLKRAEREAIVGALHKHFATQLASLSLPAEGYEKEGDIDLFPTTTVDNSINK